MGDPSSPCDIVDPTVPTDPIRMCFVGNKELSGASVGDKLPLLDLLSSLGRLLSVTDPPCLALNSTK